MRRVVALLAFSSGLGLTGAGAVDNCPRAVIELFTSQGCSSCPAADRTLARLAEDKDVIALSFPVTYWDYLGWKDTLARSEFTDRQRAYASLRRDRAIYTPQAVINGREHVIGSDEAALNKAIDRQIESAVAPSVPIEATVNGDVISARIGAAANVAGSTPLWLVQFDRKDTVQIGRGENRGREVTYTHVVRQMQPIGMWKGQAMSIDLPAKDLLKDPNKGIVLMLQGDLGGKPGAVLGAVLLQGGQGAQGAADAPAKP